MYNKQDMQERRVCHEEKQIADMGTGRDGLGRGRRVPWDWFLLVLYVLPQGTTVSEQETQEATAQFALPSQGSGESAASAEGGLGIPAASPEQLEPCGHHFAGGEPRRDTGVFAGEKDEKNAD